MNDCVCHFSTFPVNGLKYSLLVFSVNGKFFGTFFSELRAIVFLVLFCFLCVCVRARVLKGASVC